MTTTQADVLNAQKELLQNQLTTVDLQAVMQKARVNMQIDAVQAQLDRLNTPPV